MVEGVTRAHELPPKIGRHVVLGYLATGGMAEIFLGKEPSGRPVVIKRILPHLARQSSFVAMFVDEARIGSSVHHPNVVEVYELGQVGTDLFMVMEYLGGENTSGLLRRAVGRANKLPFALAAYLVAEACAGLHAAHELRDDSGKPLGLVHRDISPSNIFVTYTGEVKVLDFGIATAAHRLTRTATGQVKGKFSYMSPEQCRGEALDLRSDIFSLGVVLYELTTHRRLFKRPNELMVLKAVTEDPIPRPRREVAGYPDVIERICMKALSRDPDRRHASALELRNELLAAIAGLGFTADPRAALAAHMEQLFDDRIVEKRQMLSNVRTGTDLGELPTAEVDEGVDVPQVEEHSRTPIPELTAQPRRTRWVIPVVALAVIAGGIAAWLARTPELPAPPAVPRTPSLAAVAPDAPRAPLIAISVDAPAGFTVRINSVPPGAVVIVDGETKGTTPYDLHLDATRTITIRLQLADYLPVMQQLEIDHDQQILVPLAAAPVTPAPPPRAKLRPKSKTKDPFQRFD